MYTCTKVYRHSNEGLQEDVRSMKHTQGTHLLFGG